MLKWYEARCFLKFSDNGTRYYKIHCKKWKMKNIIITKLLESSPSPALPLIIVRIHCIENHCSVSISLEILCAEPERRQLTTSYNENLPHLRARSILSCLRLHSSLVLIFVIDEKIVSLWLSRTIGIWCIQQVLDPQQHLFDCDCWTPSLLFIQDTQADCARWVAIIYCHFLIQV